MRTCIASLSTGDFVDFHFLIIVSLAAIRIIRVEHHLHRNLKELPGSRVGPICRLRHMAGLCQEHCGEGLPKWFSGFVGELETVKQKM